MGLGDARQLRQPMELDVVAVPVEQVALTVAVPGRYPSSKRHGRPGDCRALTLRSAPGTGSVVYWTEQVMQGITRWLHRSNRRLGRRRGVGMVAVEGRLVQCPGNRGRA